MDLVRQRVGIFCEPVNETAPSLRNILQEWQVDLGISAIPTGDLTAWAQQGVLLMNRVLTVLPGDAGSHRNLGWEYFTEPDHQTTFR